MALAADEQTAAEKAKEAADAKAAANAKKAKELADAKAKADADKAKAVAEAKAKAEAEKAQQVADAKAKADADKVKQLADAKAKADAEKAKQAAALNGIGNLLAKRQAKEGVKVANAAPGSTPSKPTGRAGPTKENVGQTAALGAPEGNAPKLNMSQKGQMQAMLNRLIKPILPKDASAGDKKSTTVLRLHLNLDGTLASPPEVITPGATPALTYAAVRTVVRAITPQSPLRFDPVLYQSWKVIDLGVTPDKAV